LSIVWDGITEAAVLGNAHAEVRHELADAGKRYDWTRMMVILREHRDLINTTRLGGAPLFAPLHQAAHGGAPSEIIEALIQLGAWRTLQNAKGERPLDVAKRCGHQHLLEILQPVLKRRVPLGVLLKIQSHFHHVILGRAAEQAVWPSCGCPSWSHSLNSRLRTFGSLFRACMAASPISCGRRRWKPSSYPRAGVAWRAALGNGIMSPRQEANSQTRVLSDAVRTAEPLRKLVYDIGRLHKRCCRHSDHQLLVMAD
jgi:hypothetical protein